jgi:hypothetical protein
LNLRASLTLLSLALATLLFGQGGSQFYGDYRTVKALAFSNTGQLWAGTRGGLMQVGPPARTFGWNGLIDGGEVEDLWFEGPTLLGSSGTTVAAWNGQRWVAASREPRVPQPASVTGTVIQLPPRPVWPDLEGVFAAPPGNNGTHVTAVVGDSSEVVTAWYGDGLWKYDGASWSRLDAPFPFVRSLARVGDKLALASFEGAIWLRSGGAWKEVVPGQGFQGSVYSLGMMGSRVIAGTFEHGLQQFDRRWSALPSPLKHPREIAAFRQKLYVRDSTGRVDRYDGKKWVPNVFPWLLRGEATTLATGAGRLLVGQYGGWSEFDGVHWSHKLKVPELQGVVITAVAARDADRWIGTQGRGVYRASAGRIYDQRHGLPDDWVRRILLGEKSVVVGLFLGGAVEERGDSFARLTPDVQGEATGLVRSPDGRLLIGTRTGLWRDGKRVTPVGIPPLEIQAMLGIPKGLWLGLPHGTAFLPWRSLR